MTNRLRGERSPYLLQHADNPVEWYPWGEEAFARARAEDRPVLLSIGYSACHWCHVMERESFRDPETARLMNRDFVNVKVDREERPDVDAVYMKAVQAMTGRGGWPLTVFLTPSGLPFFGGTYFPPEPRHGLPAFREVLEAVARAYRTRREEVLRSGEELRSVLARLSAPPAGGAVPDPGLLEQAVRGVEAAYDPVHGGFGGAPKFPQAPVLDFLLRHHHRTGSPGALAMVEGTLGAIARGGIRDHLGGGFHRYSVDARWRVPHFEKMLYDNALLPRLYLHAHQVTGEESHRRVAEEALDFLLRELAAPGGGFYAALDADSEGEEGRFYLWTPEEVAGVLDPGDAALVREVYGVEPGGTLDGGSVLHLRVEVEAWARGQGVDPEEARARLRAARRALLAAREARPRPFRDEKIVAA